MRRTALTAPRPRHRPTTIATLSASLDPDDVAGGVRCRSWPRTKAEDLRYNYFVPNPGQVGSGKGGLKPIKYDGETGQPQRIAMLTNQFNEPLKLDGTVATKAEVVDGNAVIKLDGSTQDPTWNGKPVIAAAGKPHAGLDVGPVYNWAQNIRYDEGEDGDLDERRTGPVGVYSAEARQTALYAPFLGWTAQMTPRADGRP